MGRGLERFVRALDGFEAVLRGFPDDGWEARSPCDPWTARDVAGHMIGGLGWARAIVSEASEIPSPDDASGAGPASLAGADPLGSWRSARRSLMETCAPDTLERRVRWPFGEQTVDTGLEWFSLEVLVHTWDLETSAGLEVRLDPQLVHEQLIRLRPLSRHLRGPGMYGPELAPEPGADEQAQLLAFLGRQV